jgi:uncharacterized tellurite resistance protein B-like protein
MSIEKLLANRPVAAAHADTVLELAYLIAAADGRLDAAELEVFRQLAKQLTGKASAADLDALLDRFAGNVDHEEISARVTQLAPLLPADLRELAFEVVVALGISDLDTSRHEMDVEDQLMDALGITPARADELTAHVYEAFSAGSD